MNYNLRYKLKDIFLEQAELIEHQQSKKIFIKTQRNFRFDTKIWNIFARIINKKNKITKTNATVEIETLIIDYIKSTVVEYNTDEKEYIEKNIEELINILDEIIKESINNTRINITIDVKNKMHFIIEHLNIQARKNSRFKELSDLIKKETIVMQTNSKKKEICNSILNTQEYYKQVLELYNNIEKEFQNNIIKIK